MKNIYLVQANNVYGTERKSVYIPYAAGCIQAYCMQNSIIASNCKFAKIIYTRELGEKVISKLDKPYMVLFSSYVWNMEYNLDLAKKIKEVYPSCYITFGGHSISPDGENLKNYPFIDFLTHRFGEEPTAGLLQNLLLNKDLASVANISYRNSDGEIITTKTEPQTGTDYPSPYLTGVFDEILKDDIDFSAIFETNRGCPNSCSFCDWGSLKSKVRLFPMDRVYKEIDWFAKNKIEFIFCADGNFCLFDRDNEITDYVVKCKNLYGYPKVFRVCFTKNKFEQVFNIGVKFFNAGLDKAQTLSFQSMDQNVLRNIGRKNISTELFRNLMKRYNELNISTFSELILGLPGETYETFCSGMCNLIDNGQHFAINVYPCELLPNAEMAQKEYMEKFGIKSTRVPFKAIHTNALQKKDSVTEYSVYITATNTMNDSEWADAMLFASYVQALHNLGLLRATAIFFRYELSVDYVDFYKAIINFSKNEGNGVLNRVYKKIRKLCSGITSGTNEFVAVCDGLGDILWGFDELVFLEFYKDLKEFYQEIYNCFNDLINGNDAAEQLFEYQYNIIKKIGIKNVCIKSDYNFYDYYKNIYLNQYSPLKKEAIEITLCDDKHTDSFETFAKEAVWYGRNRRVTDYTSNCYNAKITRK